MIRNKSCSLENGFGLPRAAFSLIPASCNDHDRTAAPLRVSSFFETLYRHWENHPEIETYVIVAHGVAISTILLRLFKYPFDEFVAYRNFENCEFAVLEKNESTNRLEFRYCVRGFEEAGAAVKGDRLCFF